MITSLDDLTRWLAARGISTAAWNAGPAKDAADLWREIQAGESRLEDDPPRRVVEVVQVWVRDRAGRVLIEKEQELADGRLRTRNRPPSEKLKPGEDYAKAAARCLVEELGVAQADITLRPESYRRTERTLDSPSYPGLLTRYTIHEVDAAVRGLPAGDFSRANTAAADPVRRHGWTWEADLTPRQDG
jgi:hypothetical protein